MATENPFVFGKAAEGTFFTDRAEDVKRLSANLTHGLYRHLPMQVGI